MAQEGGLGALPLASRDPSQVYGVALACREYYLPVVLFSAWISMGTSALCQSLQTTMQSLP